MSLIFKEETHSYTLENIPVLSVTQALDEAGVTKYWEGGNQKPYYLLKGSGLHLAIQWHLKGILGDPGQFGKQVDAFKKFTKDVGFVAKDIEMRVFSKKMWYAGTLDITGSVFGDFSIIDLKSETYNHWYELQTAAYFTAYNEMFPKCKLKRRFILNLKQDGSYKLTENKCSTDISVFYGCLVVANYQKKKGSKL